MHIGTINIGPVQGDVVFGAREIPTDTEVDRLVDLDLDVLRAIVDEVEKIKEQREAGVDDDSLAEAGYDLSVEDEVAILEDTPEEPPKKTRRPASAVPLTPQNPEDQRTEIGAMSERNSHLMNIDRIFSQINSRESLINRQRAGTHTGKPYSIKGLQKNIKTNLAEAREEFQLACGSCALVCPIRGQFEKKLRIHGSPDSGVLASQESRPDHRRRLMKKFDVLCPPPKEDI